MADKWAEWRAKTPKAYQEKTREETAQEFERGFKQHGNVYRELLKKSDSKKLTEERTGEESPS